MNVAALISAARSWADRGQSDAPPSPELVAAAEAEAEQMPALSWSLRQMLDSAHILERGEGQDLLLVGSLPVDRKDLAGSLGRRFPELASEDQRQAAAEYLRAALRARRIMQRRERGNWATKW